MRTALILTGGLGTRMAPITITLNKSLIPVDGQPVLISIISQLERLGIEKISVLTGHLSWQIEYMLESMTKLLQSNLQIHRTPSDFSPAQRLLEAANFWVNSSEVILIYCDNRIRDCELANHIRRTGNRVLVQRRSPGNVKVNNLEGILYSIERSDINDYVELGYWCLPPKLLLQSLIEYRDLPKALEDMTENNRVDFLEIGEYESISNLSNYVRQRNKKRKTVFLDRDGVLVSSVSKGEYLKVPDQIEYIDSNIEYFTDLSSRYNLDFIVVTNQAGIERGLVTLEEVNKINQYIALRMLNQGIPILAFYVCPHHWESNCDCRKPKPGMLNTAILEFNLDPTLCVLIGDTNSDVQAGQEAGIKSFLLGEHVDLHERRQTFEGIYDFFTSLNFKLNAQDKE